MYNFEELDEITRKWMLEEFRNEENSGQPYRSSRLSPEGIAICPKEMERAIEHGNEEAFVRVMSEPRCWRSSEIYQRQGRSHERRINPTKAAQFMAYTEFNTWYVRGFARRLIEEGQEECRVYRAKSAWQPRTECLRHENQIYKVKDIYAGHRARYWPPPGDQNALSIPVGTNCHHTIGRI